MTPHPQQANLAKPVTVPSRTSFATLDTAANQGKCNDGANDNSVPRANILVKRRLRRARLSAR